MLHDGKRYENPEFLSTHNAAGAMGVQVKLLISVKSDSWMHAFDKKKQSKNQRDLLPSMKLKMHYEVKVYIYTKEKKHSNDMLVLCLPQGQLKICKVNMVKGRFELFKSSATGQRKLGKKQTSGEKHWPDLDQLENSRHFFSLTSPNC